jgi:hypothetical protein
MHRVDPASLRRTSNHFHPDFAAIVATAATLAGAHRPPLRSHRKRPRQLLVEFDRKTGDVAGAGHPYIGCTR